MDESDHLQPPVASIPYCFPMEKEVANSNWLVFPAQWAGLNAGRSCLIMPLQCVVRLQILHRPPPPLLGNVTSLAVCAFGRAALYFH